MSEPFFKESDCDGRGTCTPDTLEQITGIRTHGPMISLERANRLLRERGTVVYGVVYRDTKLEDFSSLNISSDTHTALLINITAIELDSAESLLAEIIKITESEFGGYSAIRAIADRAKRLREGK